MAFKMKGYSAFTKSPMKQVNFKEGDPIKTPTTGKDISQTIHSTFDQAFAAARKAGKKTFTWKGKSYHTKTKEEVEEKEKVTQPNPMGAVAIGAGSHSFQLPHYEPSPAEPAKLERP